MATYGLLTTGLVPKTAEVLRAELDQALRDSQGASIPLSDETPLGQVNAIFVERVAELWELGEAIHNGTDPDANVGAAQDAILAITGLTRKAAKASTTTLTLTGDADTSVAAGSQTSVGGTGDKFDHDAAAILVELTGWVVTTAYVVGDRVSSDSASWICSVAGTSTTTPLTAGLSQGDTFVDAPLTWIYMGDGTAAVDVAATAAETGVIAGALHTMTQIETPVGGWDSVINLAVAILGNAAETDEVVRIRREQELASGGSSPHDALRAELLDITGVTHVHLFVNNTDVTDGEGVPPHAIEALVLGGADQDIWDALLAGVAVGIGTHGDEIGTSEDSEGNDHTMAFTRPTELLIWVDIDLTYDDTKYPADGDTLVETAVVAAIEALGVGHDVNQFNLTNTLGSLGIGIIDLTDIDFSNGVDPPVGTTAIPVSSRQIARGLLARTEVVLSVAATP